MECTSLEEVNISYGLQSIGDFAFYQCSNLTKLSMPSSVNKIGMFAFYECNSNFYILAYKGTFAEKYAQDNNIAFNNMTFNNTSTVSSTEIIIGDIIIVNADIEADAGTYEFNYYYKKVEDEKWTKIETAFKSIL